MTDLEGYKDLCWFLQVGGGGGVEGGGGEGEGQRRSIDYP